MVFRRRRKESMVTLFGGDQELEVVGESHYQPNLAQAAEEFGREVPAVLLPEPDNQYDSNAVSVWVGGLQVGHLPRDLAGNYQQPIIGLMEELGQPIALAGRIVGGTDGKFFGIWLSHDPSDFGAGEPPDAVPIDRRVVDTGDAAHHATWEDMVPRTLLKAVPFLRGLLETETRPIERHFIYGELEALLYRARDAFQSALVEYDAAVASHDSEMDVIRPSLIDEFGGVPRLPLYKQMCIRQQKARDWEAALWWAERGLSVYGDGALSVANPEDLQARKAGYEAKVER